MNGKWFAPDISQIEKKLKTNAASGLSLRAARSRRKNDRSAFFITPKRSFLSLALEIFSDFSLVLLLIASVVSICFGEIALGAGALVMLIFAFATALFIYCRSQRLFESVENYFHPSVTVIRGGKAYCVDSESVVVGDVVLLCAGDVLGFDARLITSDKLKVLVRVDRNTVEERTKHAERQVGDVEYDIRNMHNMVHAGSVIKEGSARAIVTATGRYTYYGAMTGGVMLSVRGEMPRVITLIKKYFSSFSFALIIAILPFSLLCLLFSHDTVTLLTAFTALLSVAASASGITLAACRIFFERCVRDCLCFDDPSALRSAGVIEKLSGIDYLFLLDGAIASDGVMHFYRAVCVDGEVSENSELTPSAKTLGEIVSLYDSAENRTLTVGIHTPGIYSRALGEFVQKTKVDAEVLKLRCTVTGYVPANMNDNTDKLFYIDGDIRYILSVTSQISSIDACNRKVSGSEILPIEAEERAALVAKFEEYINKGKQLLIFTLSDNVAAEADVKLIFAGALVLSQRSDAAFKSSLDALSARGVKTISFVNTAANGIDARSTVAAPMLSSGVRSEDFSKAGRPITHNFGKISTYIDISRDELDALVACAHSMKKKVAVVSFSDRYKELTQQPDLIVSAAALQYRVVGGIEKEIESLDVAGSAESLSCRQDIKADADIILPRPSDKKGGLSSLLSALRSADGVYRALTGFFAYLVCAQFVRMTLVLLPMLFGSAHLDARHTLFCGAFVDLFVLVAFCVSNYPRERAGNARRAEAMLSSPLRNNAGKIAAVTIGSLTALIVPSAVGAIGVFGRYLYQTEYLFISLLLIHLVLAAYTLFDARRGAKREKGKIQKDMPIIALAAFMLAVSLLALLVQPLGALLDISEITMPYLLLAALPAAVTVILLFIIGKIRIYK